MFVERLICPLPLKLFVNTGVHWLNGNATFVLCNNAYWPPAAPFVAVIVSVVPLKLMLVSTGGVGGAVEMIPIRPSTDSPFVQARPALSVGSVRLV